ncbi:hypothetical protein LOY38_19620 [Pseudomonas sp. B21-015]|uniref:hypothetical protein n=1 Tax=Pseudomonas sp. B21-015 TaxID=2895473 RepID=UPI0021610696|nr:hypothetical protein [Pseudomonas sp. B21-015]UVM48579.1 hypothetical protein LOY38_19620 [Pseudomonas sp. B21-015]
MQKGRVPGFKRERVELESCSICEGKAVVKGLFYELICTDCNGSGWVVRGSKLVLSSDELVTQLSFKLQHAQREILALKSPSQLDGFQSQNDKANRLGAGGTNYTGD